jgi:hypothetical protein
MRAARIILTICPCSGGACGGAVWAAFFRPEEFFAR